jgi:hypothetical protein
LILQSCGSLFRSFGKQF